MILADIRGRLDRDDAQLALQLIARTSSDARDSAETALREQGIDVLLDDPRLLAAIFDSPLGARATGPLFSYVVVRHALLQVGEGERVVADYVASLLLHFGLRERANRIGESDDEEYETLASLIRDAESGDAQRSFLVRAHLGNYALWVSGLYPDHIEYRRWRRGGPAIDYYEELGQRGYRLAADHRLASEHGLDALFAAIAEKFPIVRIALNKVSDTLLFPRHSSPERLMRQVRDESRWMLS